MLPDIIGWVHVFTKSIISFQHLAPRAALGHSVPAVSHLGFITLDKSSLHDKSYLPVIRVPVHACPLQVGNPQAGNLSDDHNAEAFEYTLAPGDFVCPRFLVQ